MQQNRRFHRSRKRFTARKQRGIERKKTRQYQILTQIKRKKRKKTQQRVRKSLYLCSTARRKNHENTASPIVFPLNHRSYAPIQSLFPPRIQRLPRRQERTVAPPNGHRGFRPLCDGALSPARLSRLHGRTRLRRAGLRTPRRPRPRPPRGGRLRALPPRPRARHFHRRSPARGGRHRSPTLPIEAQQRRTTPPREEKFAPNDRHPQHAPRGNDGGGRPHAPRRRNRGNRRRHRRPVLRRNGGGGRHYRHAPRPTDRRRGSRQRERAGEKLSIPRGKKRRK